MAKKNKNLLVGTRPVLEIFDTDKVVSKILMKRGANGEQHQAILEQAKRHKIPLQLVPLEKLNRIFGGNHQGVVAFLSPIPYHDLEHTLIGLFEQGKSPFIVVLDGITDVRNFGAIARTAECAGVDAIVIPEKGSVDITEDAIKTSAGALHKIPVCRVSNLHLAIKYMKQSGLKVMAASEKGNKTYFEETTDEPIALVMGAEDTGVSAQVLKEVDVLTSIPLHGTINSLNVSVAFGIIAFDIVKKRIG
ncbi:MAG: 23S rRNA (guanosine(2251)-2'-O)-methyltransferase RlmB [Bacteroidales bacterium]|nr:23S rRNA (guanosine(2251)-2'-O)-methyltransferase RlmB [Bacteroidales bacterium]